MSGHPGIRRVNIRFEPEMGDDGTWLLRCDDCVARGESTAYWPLTKEFWAPSQGLQRCRACHNGHKRRNHKQTVEERRARQRKWYLEDHERRLKYAADYLEANRERINSRRRARRELTKDQDNARRRERAARKKAA